MKGESQNTSLPIRGGYRIWRRGGGDFQPRSCEEELFFAVFCDMREPVLDRIGKAKY